MTGKFQKGSGLASAVDPLARHRAAATPSILKVRDCQSALRLQDEKDDIKMIEVGSIGSTAQDSHQSQA